jgi:ABC-type lipoprotein export system ATPase subunit
VIRISDLRFRYGADGFSLSIPELSLERGSTVAVIGPSGTGKTTLLNLAAGIIRPERGTVRVGEVAVSALGEGECRDFRIRHIGLVFQEFELLEYLNVLDNILLPYRISPALALTAEVRARALRLAEEVGMADKVRRRIDRLSQGERQRVAVCRALLPEPVVLLCDEPTGNLDPANREHVLDIIFDYVSRNDTTLVTVTHDHDILGRFERRVDTSAFAATAA